MMTFENKQWIPDNFWTTLSHRGALKLHHQSLDIFLNSNGFSMDYPWALPVQSLFAFVLYLRVHKSMLFPAVHDQVIGISMSDPFRVDINAWLCYAEAYAGVLFLAFLDKFSLQHFHMCKPVFSRNFHLMLKDFFWL